MSTTTDERTSNARDVLERVRALTPAIAARADEIEAHRTLPPDLVEDLRAAGCFRMLVPRSHRGSELDLLTHMRVLAELARADGSVGWTVMIGSVGPGILGLLPRSTFDAIYADSPDVILAGTFNPTGVATPTEGGYRVSGRWALASGCQHADRFIAHCVVPDGRVPPVRMMVFAPAEVEIQDTWWVSGLRGTGSHDFVVTDAFVPEERTFCVEDPANLDGPLWRVPEVSAAALNIANIGVAIAEAALADIVELARGKVPAFADAALAANPHFQHQLARADAQLRAARRSLDAEAESIWDLALTGEPITLHQRARLRATTTVATFAAAAAVDTAYEAGGATAMYDTSPLQRRFRDIHALTQHFLVKSDSLTTAGAVLLDQDVEVMFL